MNHSLEIRGVTLTAKSIKGMDRLKKVQKAINLLDTTSLRHVKIASKVGYESIAYLRSAAKILGFKDFESQTAKLSMLDENDWRKYAKRHQEGATTLELSIEIGTTKQTVLNSYFRYSAAKRNIIAFYETF